MRRKPGFLWAAWLDAHRAHSPIITLLVVTPYLDQRIRIGTRLPSVYAQNTTHFPILIPFLAAISAFLYLFMHQLLAPESSTKLLEHSPKVTTNSSESSPKLLEHSPKYPENPSESWLKLPEHSPKITENSPESSPKLLEHSPKYPENPSESSPKLLEHSLKVTENSPKFCSRHYIVYTLHYFKLRNYLLKFFCVKYAPDKSFPPSYLTFTRYLPLSTPLRSVWSLPKVHRDFQNILRKLL